MRSRSKGEEESSYDPSELTGFVTYRLSQTQGRLNAQASRLLREHAGIGVVQWRIVTTLARFAPASAREVTERLPMDTGLLSRNLKALVEAGHVDSRRDSADRRRQVLTLTARGRRLHARVFPVMRRRQARLLAGVNPADRAAFFRVLDVLDEHALEPEGP